jgi:hypothetical protein
VERSPHEGVSSALASALSEFARGAVLLVDESGKIVLASAVAQRLVNRNQTELAGISLDEVISDGVTALMEAEADGRSRYVDAWLRNGGGLVPIEVAPARVPDGGMIAFAVSIRLASDDAEATAGARGRYDAFLAEIARFVGRGEPGEDRIDGVLALIAAALEVRGVAAIVFVGREEPAVHLCGIPEELARALMKCVAAQACDDRVHALHLSDLGEDHRPFVSAVRRSEFREGIVLELSSAGERVAVLTALSKSPQRFDAAAQDFFDRAGTMLSRAIVR